MKQKPLILQKKFSGFFWTQFLGAFNDNAFKQSVIFMITFKLASQLPEGTADQLVPLGAGIFILPFVLFSPWAATWSDRAGKTKVIVATKILEIGIMICGLLGFYLLNPQNPSTGIYFLMVVIFLMGTQSTLFSPAKYGIMPEILKDEELTEGNGFLEMGTFVSILLGQFAGGWLVELFGHSPYFMSFFFIAISICGWLTSLRVPRTKPVEPHQKYALFFPRKIKQDFFKLRKNRLVFIVVMGISFFWFLGAALLTIVPGYGVFLGASLTQTNFLMIAFSLGIGLGSLLCAILSDGKIEMGLVPLGAFGMIGFSFAFGFLYPESVNSWSDMLWSYFQLFGLGMFGGFFIVPLNSLLQQRTSDQERASMIALNNIINALFMVISSGFIMGCMSAGLSQPQVIQLLGGTIIFGMIYLCLQQPEFFIRFILWGFTRLFYRVTITNRQHIPLHHSILFVTGHLDFIHACLIQMTTHRHIRFVVNFENCQNSVTKWTLQQMGAIFVAESENTNNAELLSVQIIDALKQGDVVCIAQAHQNILKNISYPTIPVHLHGMPHDSHPVSLFQPLTISFGELLPSPHRFL
ncbi:MAG: MFS transporter [SAR324 cluster bacterium]|nr:MFS transporter [SAR324 cluster bacterium]